MLTTALATVLLATAASAAPVEARLELLPDNDRLHLRLCFSSAKPHQLTYQLEVRTIGKAGTSRSRQSGRLTSGSEAQCPLNNRLGLAKDSRIEATLTWSVDGEEQPALHQAYPAVQPTSPTPGSSPGEEQTEQIARADSHLR
ncbi:curli-like amyloid fiber formation chaperone CsgH [Stutzerimonas zhaodongensis]|uniref:curli-like amyloid fiber formation chaperone CsgH n=1 Tax=Stutzerimonas zhaodongensis TaxID=1176257 RepID=UPI001FCA106D|nr:curli-like amyloid fiber formation chaperone CsgH [Stutzerimonas zhaodongensis]MCQ4316444.1 hypothetical protein [Stutzerimonas zhaodongensis]